MKSVNDCVFKSSRDNTVVPGFNVFGHEDALAITRAAERADSPVILMVNRDASRIMDIAHWGALLASIANQAAVPVGVHLDHCSDKNLIIRAMDNGFTSVMYDGSKLPLNLNILNTREIVIRAHERGICVEGEVGMVPYYDKGEQLGAFTTPDEAQALYEESGVDWLAVSVGNIHRLTATKVPIDFEALKAIELVCSAPLVIHGASGIREADIQHIKNTQVGKINIGTALRRVFGEALRKEISNHPKIFDRLALFKNPVIGVEAKAYELISALL